MSSEHDSIEFVNSSGLIELIRKKTTPIKVLIKQLIIAFNINKFLKLKSKIHKFLLPEGITRTLSVEL